MYNTIKPVMTEDGQYDRNFQVGDTVQHFKGGLYKIVALATHTETKEILVIYQSIKDRKTWARPYAMFTSEVDKDKYPDVKQKYRLIKVDMEEACKTCVYKTCIYAGTTICETTLPCMHWSLVIGEESEYGKSNM